MEVGLLFSGGKDSALAAHLLAGSCEVTLLCGTFGVTDDHEHALAAGERLGFPTERLALDRTVADAAVERMVADGYPREGVQQVHEHAVERAAETWPAVADGTRRDDRVPTVDRPLAQSVEDRHDCHYLAPLAGMGRGAIDELVAATFAVETGPSEQVPKGDYEAELRALLAAAEDPETVGEVFPEHVQSRVRGYAADADADATDRGDAP